MKRKYVATHILCKKWTIFKEKLLILHDKHSTMLFYDPFSEMRESSLETGGLDLTVPLKMRFR
jgi:hypothetical protein